MSDEQGRVTFQGQAPFLLPVAQRARAGGNPNNGVTMTIYVLSETSPQTQLPVDVQMTGKVARELAVQLLRAADEAEKD